MAAFGSTEHVRSLSRRELENLFRYVLKSRDELQTIITRQSREIFELRRKVARQAKQLKAVQAALEKRNRELDKYSEAVQRMAPFALYGAEKLCPSRDCFMFEECVTISDERCPAEERMEDMLREIGGVLDAQLHDVSAQ